MLGKSKKYLGKLGEKIACDFLTKKGYKILRNNYQKLFGEIDIIARDTDILVFFEVKTRTSNKFGSGAEAVTRKKQEKLIKTAYCYLNEKKMRDNEFRIDVLSINLNFNRRRAKITHFRNAIGEN